MQGQHSELWWITEEGTGLDAEHLGHSSLRTTLDWFYLLLLNIVSVLWTPVTCL